MRDLLKWMGATALVGAAGMANATVVVDVSLTPWTSEVVDLNTSDAVAASLTTGAEGYTLSSSYYASPLHGAEQSASDSCGNCAISSVAGYMGITRAEGTGKPGETSIHVVTTPDFESTPTYSTHIGSVWWRFATFDLGANSQVTFRTHLSVNAVVTHDGMADDVDLTTTILFDPACTGMASDSPGCGKTEFTLDGTGTLSEERDLSMVFTNHGNTAMQIVFLSILGASTEIDNIPVSEVPEPSTYAMLGVGLAGLWARSRRKNSQVGHS